MKEKQAYKGLLFTDHLAGYWMHYGEILYPKFLCITLVYFILIFLLNRADNYFHLKGFFRWCLLPRTTIFQTNS